MAPRASTRAEGGVKADCFDQCIRCVVFQAALSLTVADLPFCLLPRTLIGPGDMAVNTLLTAIGLTLNVSGHNRVIPLPFSFMI